MCTKVIIKWQIQKFVAVLDKSYSRVFPKVLSFLHDDLKLGSGVNPINEFHLKKTFTGAKQT